MRTERGAEPDGALREYLATRDVPCPSCGYNLRGVPASTCPECAMPLDLEIVKEGTVQQQAERAGTVTKLAEAGQLDDTPAGPFLLAVAIVLTIGAIVGFVALAMR